MHSSILIHLFQLYFLNISFHVYVPHLRCRCFVDRIEDVNALVQRHFEDIRCISSWRHQCFVANVIWRYYPLLVISFLASMPSATLFNQCSVAYIDCWESWYHCPVAHITSKGMREFYYFNEAFIPLFCWQFWFYVCNQIYQTRPLSSNHNIKSQPKTSKFSLP